MSTTALIPSAVGPVTLTVPDLDRSLKFYRDALGLEPFRGFEGTFSLGAGGEVLVRLEERPGAIAPRRSTGLYHLALLLPSRLDLARQLRHFADAGVPLQGASDHLVSEALYLADPDGNGIEVYRDRPSDQWRRDGGQIRMTTDPLDVQGLMSELDRAPGAWSGMPEGTVMGHVHLRVSDVPSAEAFYHDVLGMDVTTRYGPSASFMSWDGYHHHLGLNTWGSQGAPPPPAGAAGLRHFTLRPTNAARFEQIMRAAETRRAPTEAVGDGFLLRDPAGNGLVVVPPAASA